MKLNGQAKIDFEKWYGVNVEFVGEVLYLEEFYILPGSMKYGVLVNWFDSVGIEIIMKEIRSSAPNTNTIYRAVINDSINTGSWKNSRPEARTAAITKATELYNNRK